MKKIFLFIFSILYLGLSCGFAFNIHYCMGKFSSVDVFKTEDKHCDKCGMKKHKGCCDSKLTVLKISDTQQVTSAQLHINAPILPQINQNFFTAFQPVSTPLKSTVRNLSPPPDSGAFMCILHSTFII